MSLISNANSNSGYRHSSLKASPRPHRESLGLESPYWCRAHHRRISLQLTSALALTPSGINKLSCLLQFCSHLYTRCWPGTLVLWIKGWICQTSSLITQLEDAMQMAQHLPAFSRQSCLLMFCSSSSVLIPGSKAQTPTATHSAQRLSMGRTREINREVFPHHTYHKGS